MKSSINLDTFPPDQAELVRSACVRIAAHADQTPAAYGATLILPGEQPLYISVKEARRLIRNAQCGRRV